MFRITEGPSSGSLVQCLAKNCNNGSIVSVDMDRVSVMAAHSFLYSELHTRSQYAAITPTLSMSTDTIEPLLQFLAKHCTRLPDMDPL